MDLTEDGTLVLFDPESNGPPIWTSRNAIWSIEGIKPGQELPRGTRVFAVRNIDKVPTMAGGKPLAGAQLYAFRNFFMELQNDGNFVVKSARADLSYKWGLDRMPGLNLADIDRMRMNEDGRLIALSVSGAELWSVPSSGAIPGSLLNLSTDGKLQIVSPDFKEVIWQNQ